MMSLTRIRLLGLIFGLVVLSACDTAEERAEGHYQRGLELVEKGETAKALLEFRNALQLNENAIEPRLETARIRLAQGEIQGAVGHYRRIIELDQNNLEARLTVGRVLLQIENEQDGAREHINAAADIAPDNIQVRGLVAGLAQREGRFEEAETLALALLEDDPGNGIAVSILVAQKTEQEDYSGIITLIDKALVATPVDLGLHVARLQALEGLGDGPGIGKQLENMARLFPENPQVAQGRVQWFLNNGNNTAAVGAQRDLAALFPDEPSYALQVVSLLNQFEGIDSARRELVNLASGQDHIAVFTRALADFELQQGNVDAAIGHLEGLLDTDIGTEDSHDAQAQLANILRANGDAPRALAMAEQILAKNETHVEALKLRALASVDADRPEKAITDLRTALNAQKPDPVILMMLAMAHERNGSVNLALERMALAVRASESGVIESLRYAEMLTRQDKIDIALSTLKTAREKHGPLPSLLAGIGQIQVMLSDWTGATDTVVQLASIKDDPQSRKVAQELQIAILEGEQRFERSIGVLREMWDSAGEGTSAMENLVRNYVLSGKTEDAAKFLNEILLKDETNMRASLLRGALYAFEDQIDKAEAQYRQVIDDHPLRENGYGALASLLAFQGRIEEADLVIEDGINNAENPQRLLFSRASRLEELQDYEGAIAIYEQLYEENRDSDVLANNLASLLSEFRDDPESLERAFNIAKRLRSSVQPAFQDTYGWILYKRGEYERAVQPLKAAADGAQDNVFVQYHLGMVYEKLGQKELAIAQLTKALELGEGSNLPVLSEIRSVLERLKGA